MVKAGAWLVPLALGLGIVAVVILGPRIAHAPVEPARLAPSQTMQGSWVDLAPMPEPRQEMGVAALDGRIYAIGGFRADGTSADTVEVYDPATNSWQRAASLPQALNHPAAASVGGRVYVIGGHPDLGPEAVDTVYAYDPVTNA